MALDFPPNVIDVAVTAPVTRYFRRTNIYEADNSTLFAADVPMVSANITIDLASSHRRSADLTLFNTGILDIDGRDVAAIARQIRAGKGCR